MIKYQKGFKYQLQEDYTLKTDILGFDVETDFITLDRDGCLFIRKGYAWDGASGPTIDTKSSMEASLVHDSLYQLMRLGLLPRGFRSKVDNLFKGICIDKKMYKSRANVWCYLVKKFAKSAASAANIRKVYIVS